MILTGYDVVITLSSNKSVLELEEKCMEVRECFNNVGGIMIYGGDSTISRKYAHVGANFAARKSDFRRVQKNMIMGACLSKKDFLWIEYECDLSSFKNIEIQPGLHFPNKVSPKLKSFDKITYKRTKELMLRRSFKNYKDLFNLSPIFINSEKFKILDDFDYNSAYGICTKTVYINYNRI